MQTDTLYSNWGISLWSIASNPCCSWSRLRRNVFLIASKWLELGFFFWKHLLIVFCVTNRQTLHFLTQSFIPTCQIAVCCRYVGTSTTVVTICPYHYCKAFCRLLFLWWQQGTIVQIHFVKGFKKQMLFVLIGDCVYLSVNLVFCLQKNLENKSVHNETQ